METKKIIASGKWTVTQVVECECNCPVSKTVVTDLSGRIIGKFDDSISVEDAKMIANAPTMVDMLMAIESELSSIICDETRSINDLWNLLYRLRLSIDKLMN